ncbi:Serine/threonine exchanger SteT [bioreactor metagenome]
MKNPGKDLPRAIVGGLSVVMAVYIVINIAYLWVAPASELASATAPAALVAQRIFGPVGGKLITIGILISVFGALNGYLLTGPRVPYTLAKQGTLPGSKTFAKLNKGNVPANAIWLLAVLASLYALSGQFNLLTDLTVFTIWVFYVFTFVGVMKLRKDKPQLNRPYKVPLYPIIPLIAITGGLIVIVNQLITATMIALGGIIITLIGIPVYAVTSKNSK